MENLYSQPKKTEKVGESALIDEIPLPSHPGVVEPIIAAEAIAHPPQGIQTDPLGSYTGRPVDGGVPVQDADDL